MVDESAGTGHVHDHDRSAGHPARVAVGDGEVLFGTTSWADRGLVQSGAFYPKKAMNARERLAFYASRFAMAEVATTYRFPPTADLARQWIERTPEGFVFDIRAWSLLTGAPTLPDSLWPDLQDQIIDRSRDQRRLYRAHLTPEAVDECWERFDHAIRPLVDAGRLGAVILQYPSWFTPRPEAWAELALVRTRLAGVKFAVDLRSPKWTSGGACEETFEWLEEHGLAFVCTDGPLDGPRAVPPVAAVTSDLAVVRFVGRRFSDTDPWTYPHRYSREELAGWVPKLQSLADSAQQVHVIMDNTWGSDAVDNALALAELTAGAQRGEPLWTTDP